MAPVARGRADALALNYAFRMTTVTIRGATEQIEDADLHVNLRLLLKLPKLFPAA